MFSTKCSPSDYHIHQISPVISHFPQDPRHQEPPRGSAGFGRDEALWVLIWVPQTIGFPIDVYNCNYMYNYLYIYI